ncbi:MAG TPA: glycosyltransferase family 39 protein [Vicinamibacterales bacterium]|nr:glycosyltransferase family 39 protein [Vicinamibacterales bacterium]
MTFVFSSDGRRALRVSLALGLLVRLAIFWHTPTLGPEIEDEQHYVQLANNVIEGNGFAFAPGRPTSIRPPLYPGLVATIFSITGAGNLQAVRLVQILLALLTVAVIVELGRQAFTAAVGRYGAAIFFLYPSYIFFNFTILTETLFTLLLIAFVLLSVRLVQTPRLSTALLCGLTLGLAALTRSVLWPTPLIFCPLLVLLLRAPWRTRLALPAAVLAGYAVVVSPWAIRNTRLQGVVTIVDTMGGMNLRMGNYEYTPDDRMWAAVGLSGEQNWSYSIAQEFPGQHLTEGQKEKWAQSKAIAYMRAHPGTTLRRALIKFADFWGLEREYAAGVQQGMYSPPRWVGAAASLLIVVVYLGVIVCGAAGVWLAAPAWRVQVLLLLPVVIITGVHTLVFGHPRYHLPLMPLFALYASALLATRSVAAWRERRPALVGASATVLMLVAVWVRQIVVVDAQRIRAFLNHVS